jgi:hypothetical protein
MTFSSDLRVLEFGDADEVSDMELSLHIGKVLQRVYPNHPWIIGFQGRALVLRHLAIASEVTRVIGRSGFASMLPRERLGTPKQVTRSAVMFAGQLLEAFGLPRGPWDGSLPTVPNWNRNKERSFT